MNLVSVCHADDAQMIWNYIEEYSPGIKSKKNLLLDKLINNALVYYNDMVKPLKKYRTPDDLERKSFIDLITKLENMDHNISSEDIQTEVFTVGKENNYENLREWFKTIYEVLLGQTEGPRMGSFIKLYGIKKTISLIKSKI